ncbi:Nif3-like dinuclear metal center hexameric protein [Cryobacterium sp. SO2]|uniref:Nif3-like dinuclear metal center hexameric protein n=1 Tax=Cryobacterium sp. SO2 TaxID=1897060 RepID=UPI00223E7ECA|nr:Nif3-like dinuclear metal center hexameric protein [Cryobacterium sp. SO2]WEO79136.1 Nif3-like dinuclear metal center hexameric protein [Cryobacterium sp. SO2]
MSFSLAEVARVSHDLWPLSGAEDWDAPGLVSGDPAARVESILLAVDVVADTVAEAVDTGADLLLAHHPLLLRGVTSVAEDRYKGALLARLIRADCALLAAHTNADVVADGVSDIFAQRLGLTDVRPITTGTAPGTAPGTGIGRVGRLAEPTTVGALARLLAELVPPTASGIRAAGGYSDIVRTVALCGGAGDSLLREPPVRSADVFITSDLRHHPVSESREQSMLAGVGPALIDVSHWASEWLWLETAAQQLRARLPGILVQVSDLSTDPWDFVVTQ